MNPLSLPQSLCTLGTLAHARDRGLFQDPTTQGPDLRPILLTVGGGEGEAGRVTTAAARRLGGVHSRNLWLALS